MRRALALVWLVASGCWGPMCLVRGTPVATPTGERRVETLVVGDRVRTPGGAIAITATRRGVAGEYLRLEHEGGALSLTGRHPVLTAEGWRNAGELVVGARLRTEAGWSRLRRVVRCAGPVEVFELSVEAPHRYLAGGVVVHNKSVIPTQSWVPPEEVERRARLIEDCLGVAPSWRAQLDYTGGARGVTLRGGQVVVETDRGKLWAVRAADGAIAYGIPVDPDGKGSRRRVESIAHGGRHLHVQLDDGSVSTLDPYGNLEYRTALARPATTGIAATATRIVFVSGDRLVSRSVLVRSAQTVALPGRVTAAPLVVGEVAYVGDTGGRVQAFSLSEGQVLDRLWRARGAGAVARLHRDGERLIAVGRDGSLTAFAWTGRRLWRAEVGARPDRELVGDGQLLVAATGQGAVALDAATGARRWEAAGVEMLLALGGRQVYARHETDAGRAVVVLARADGSVVRREDVGAQVDVWLTNPTGPRVILGSTYRGRAVLLFGVEVR